MNDDDDDDDHSLHSENRWNAPSNVASEKWNELREKSA